MEVLAAKSDLEVWFAAFAQGQLLEPGDLLLPPRQVSGVVLRGG